MSRKSPYWVIFNLLTLAGAVLGPARPLGTHNLRVGAEITSQNSRPDLGQILLRRLFETIKVSMCTITGMSRAEPPDTFGLKTHDILQIHLPGLLK